MLRTLTIAVSILSFAGGALAQDDKPYFANSYAVVVGIDGYAHQDWAKLRYAVPDARAISQLLQEQGFKVTELFGEKATRAAIVAALEDTLAPTLGAEDRVVFFFAGHGTQRVIGETEQGFLVPYDAGGATSYSTLIRLTELHALSETMGAAKHQLFILDSCFGGLAAMRDALSTTIDPRVPNYLRVISDRKVRQLLTAGGKDQKVSDGGSLGHSLFTGQLLAAVREGKADINGDRAITFNEIAAYIVPAASSYQQTPGIAQLRGHALGEFWFASGAPGPVIDTSRPPATATPLADPYAALRAGKQAFLSRNYAKARGDFQVAAELGNAEAMNYLGLLLWHGWGGAADQAAGIRWLRAAAERGHEAAMESLGNIYSAAGPMHDPAEAQRWKTAREEARKLVASITITDPSGQAGRGDPEIPRDATVVRPRAPTGLTVQ